MSRLLPPPSANPFQRWLGAPAAGALVVLLLFAFLHWAITPRELPGLVEGPANEGIQLVKVAPDTPQPEPEAQQAPENAPPPPPDAPPSLARPELSASAAPALTNVEIDAGPVVVNTGPVTGVNLGVGGSGLTGIGSGAFGGFAGGGGGGGGGQGFATGKGFEGKTLIPLSTARPQMPEWACKQKLKGWVEVVFTVMPNGRVRDVKIVDADPKGVYEAAAIESVSNWIYSPFKSAREVKQRVPMNPEDCEFNYPQ